MEEFIQQLLKDKGLPPNMDEAVKAQLTKDLTDRATNLVNRRLIDAMSDEAVAAFEQLIDEKPDNTEAIQQFIETHVSNREAIAGAALLEFRALYLGARA